MKLDQAAVARIKLPPGKSDVILFDDRLRGFGLRLRAGGKKSWLLQYRVGRQQRRLSLGDAEKMTAASARERAVEESARIALGSDPQLDKQQKRAESADTLGAIIELHLAAQRAKMKPRSFESIEAHLNKHWSPLHRLSIHEITPKHIVHVLLEIEAQRGAIAAKRARATLAHLFSWSIKKQIVAANPVIGTEVDVEETPRERVLTDPELVSIWNACRDDDHGAIVKLLLLTGQRRDEIASAVRSEIDLDARLLRLPGARTKNHRAHDVHLSDPALAIFADTMRHEGREDRALIFGDGKGAFSGWSAAKRALDKRIAEMTGAALPDWRLHDLRRTAASGMARLGVDLHVIERCLNHVSGSFGGIVQVYQRHKFEDGMKRALDLWAAHVVGIVEGREPASNVVSLRA